MTQEEQRAYGKGYAAGRKFVDQPHERRLARMALATAIAPEIVQNPWQRTVNGSVQRMNTAEGIAETVSEIVRAIERKLS